MNASPGRLIWNMESTDVKGDFERFKSAGATVIADPYTMEGDESGSLIATFADPDGNYFQIGDPNGAQFVRRLIVTEFLSVDGVMQGPGSPDEDRDGGFEHGGWQADYFDEGVLAGAQEGMGNADAYLFGRRTYQIMAAHWPTAPVGRPVRRPSERHEKYVASRTLKELQWQNSELLEGDAGEAVARLKEQPGKDIVVLGSGDLVQTLMAHGLVDEFGLIVSPLVLGSGKRLFRDADQVKRLELASSKVHAEGQPGAVVPARQLIGGCQE